MTRRRASEYLPCFLALLVAAASAMATVSPAAGLRQIISFNREWKFELGDVPGAEAARFDDSRWDDENLPHSFSMPYFAADRFYTGYGWYRKHFDLPRAWSGRRINLEFDGAFQVAELFVDGKRVGEHKGGYTGFTFDITEAVKPGDNVVAVRVNNNWDPRLAPRAGEHVFSGGIYRDVRLVITAPLHVAWYGTFVTTPQVSKAAGTVNVKTEVVNDSGAAKSVTVKTRVVDAREQTVAEMESAQRVAAGATNVFDQTSAPIAQPELWSPEHPNLYSVRTSVLDDGKPVDDFTSPLGFRWFQWTADQGFFLNGEHYYFKGANVHQDHAGWGDAVADSGFFRDVNLIKGAGFDFIRGSHYPHAPAFAAACDQIGILFWSENCFWGTAGFHSPWAASAYPTNPADEPEFEASVKASLRDEIRIHRNHPSIIAWSMDNEVFFSSSAVMPKVRRFLGNSFPTRMNWMQPARPPSGVVSAAKWTSSGMWRVTMATARACLPIRECPASSPNTDPPWRIVRATMNLAGAICRARRARSKTSPAPGVCRGAAAKRFGAASTTAVLPAGASVRWDWWIISACRSARGIGIVTRICTLRRRPGPATAFPPR